MLVTRSVAVLCAVFPLFAVVGCVDRTAPASQTPAQGSSATSPNAPGAALVIRVNQHGYLPGVAQLATVVTVDREPKTWELVAADGRTLASGKTIPFGPDADSGDSVHTVDFGSRADAKAPAEGKGLVLRIGDVKSVPFDIGRDVYKPLVSDALWYFYQNRSGIDIAMPYAGKAAWGRPAGHLDDHQAHCMPESPCPYTLDAAGGWYDAGDQGKYVVNAGIAVWTLQNLYERTQVFAPAELKAFADGTLRIPEHANGLPDLLDEARWEMDWMLRMQVPEGSPNAGMAHHKLHDSVWTPLGTAPPAKSSDINVTRFLHPVSTAATLNLAASAAQAARIWQKLDPAFAARCKTSAVRAWQAAQKDPKKLASPTDKKGGGAYEDDELSDEFYWAASELYVTTGEAEYGRFVKASPLYLRVADHAQAGFASAMSWQSVASLGTISLAIAPNGLEKDAVASARKALVARADDYLEASRRQGYGVPMGQGKANYVWGSSSQVANNGVILAYAYDFTHDRKYIDGAARAMSYLLGNNTLGQSYVMGYGENASQHPHHRFWVLVAEEPVGLPPGALVGGPNAMLQDPVMTDHDHKHCKPQGCYADDQEAYSVNEVAINWNAPLVWLASFLDERGRTLMAR